MGGAQACACIKSLNDESIFNDFFKDLLINEKPVQDIYDVITIKKGSKVTNEINDKKWFIIIESILYNLNNKEISINYWQKVIKYIKENSKENYLILSLFFFPHDKLEDCKTYFIKFLNLMREETNEEKMKMISKDELKNILTIYIYMISRGAAEDLQALSNDPKNMVDYCNTVFSDENIEKYVNEKFLSNEEDEIDINTFLNNHYKLINDNSLIRNEISQNYYKNNIEKK
jgi:hypothetical protein